MYIVCILNSFSYFEEFDKLFNFIKSVFVFLLSFGFFLGGGALDRPMAVWFSNGTGMIAALVYGRFENEC